MSRVRGMTNPAAGLDRTDQPEVLHVLPYFRPAFGMGGPAFTSDILTIALSRMGYRISVWTTDIASPDGTRLTDLLESSEKVDVRRYRYVSRSLYRISNLLASPRMMIDALASG